MLMPKPTNAHFRRSETVVLISSSRYLEMVCRLPRHLTPIVLEQLPTVRLAGGCIDGFDDAFR